MRIFCFLFLFNPMAEPWGTVFKGEGGEGWGVRGGSGNVWRSEAVVVPLQKEK